MVETVVTHLVHIGNYGDFNTAAKFSSTTTAKDIQCYAEKIFINTLRNSPILSMYQCRIEIEHKPGVFMLLEDRYIKDFQPFGEEAYQKDVNEYNINQQQNIDANQRESSMDSFDYTVFSDLFGKDLSVDVGRADLSWGIDEPICNQRIATFDDQSQLSTKPSFVQNSNMHSNTTLHPVSLNETRNASRLPCTFIDEPQLPSTIENSFNPPGMSFLF
ncbi:unnamed protein product [Rotaria sp. Silwood1]|nr:unnamed protein product [Rotaria sp. Silwood1]CAF1001588.1 unnamed protein product [Rotaria sp. Silwood1]CAF1010527.1 unnamed protein product [Rotaria sp. Silwood1]CAF3420823.1 unnamed protein product [Rotaria sp. Silwood1]CAF4683781.1 unnamed protein product [Rotaria sp. Silwood1]